MNEFGAWALLTAILLGGGAHWFRHNVSYETGYCILTLQAVFVAVCIGCVASMATMEFLGESNGTRNR